MWTTVIWRYLQFELMDLDLVSIVMDVQKRVAHELMHSQMSRRYWTNISHLHKSRNCWKVPLFPKIVVDFRAS